MSNDNWRSCGNRPRDPKRRRRRRCCARALRTCWCLFRDDAALDEVHEMLRELTAIHPSRVLAMLGDRGSADHDIEMSVESICQTDKRTGAKRLCCEEITLEGAGKVCRLNFPAPRCRCWCRICRRFFGGAMRRKLADKVLDKLLRATDRLVIDSAEFADPLHDLGETNKLFRAKDYDHVGISDLNWARLTFWRGLLADFYDVAAYQPWLERIDSVQIDYVAPEGEERRWRRKHC